MALDDQIGSADNNVKTNNYVKRLCNDDSGKGSPVGGPIKCTLMKNHKFSGHWNYKFKKEWV